MARNEAPPAGHSGARRGPSAEIAMRRLDWVRITMGKCGEPTCEAVGVSHRLPSVQRIPLWLAVSLAAGGVPTVVRHAGALGEG